MKSAGIETLKERIKVKFKDGEETFFKRYDLKDVKVIKRTKKGRFFHTFSTHYGNILSFFWRKKFILQILLHNSLRRFYNLDSPYCTL